MQAEHTRPGGFIISPLGQSVPIAKTRPISSRKFKFNISCFFKPIYEIFSECIDLSVNILGSAAKKVLSVGVAICCVMVFFNFFTFGTSICYNGKQIAVSSDEESYIEALSAVGGFLSSNNIKSSNLHFTTSPTLTLRSSITNGSNLRDNLLLCSSKLSRGCTVYSNDVPVFTAKDEKTAKSVVEKYISDCCVGSDAKTTTNIKYKTNIVETSNISDFEECRSLIKNSKEVKVISIVNTTQNQEIPFDTKSTQDDTLYIGESVTVTEGKIGKTQIESETVYENGAPRSSRVLSENILITPVSRVVRVGTKTKDVLKTGLLYPLQGVISSDYGERWGKMHEGIDIAVPEGTPVMAAECGKVMYAGDGGTYGNLVRIDHGNGIVTAYAHLSLINVKVGQSVNANTQIALSGNTGRSTGPHLHFEIVNNDEPVNPNLYLKKRAHSAN